VCEGGALEGGEGCVGYDTAVQRGGWSCSTAPGSLRSAAYARFNDRAVEVGSSR
jgi:hypothetical protein